LKVYIADARGIAVFDANGRFNAEGDSGHGMAYDGDDALWVVQIASITRYSIGR
jgi:hypothetical protein